MKVFRIVALAFIIWSPILPYNLFAKSNCPLFVTAIAKTITIYTTLDGQISGNVIAESGNSISLDIKNTNGLFVKWYVGKKIQTWDKMTIYFTIYSEGISYSCQYKITMR